VATRSSSKAKSKSTAASVARARAAALRAQAAQQERRRKLLLLVGVGIVALAIVASAALWSGRERNQAAADLAQVSGLGAEQTPPWPAPADVSARAEKAGIPLGPMGTAEHYHAHLDVLVNGQPVPVPANIGVDPATGTMSVVHTHTPDGVIHVEAARRGQPFTLGQLFTQWNVRLTATQIGGLKVGGETALTMYLNGRKVPGDPATLRLASHQQIALVYGPKGQTVEVPSSYDFAPGE
jgi:FAD/FMN-containing dehydrogenase